MAFNYSPKLITDGLVLYLDAANTRSYPTTGTTWNDLSRSVNNCTLQNNPTFSGSNNGVLIFDSVDDRGFIPYNTNLDLCNIPNWTISVWLNLTDTLGTFNSIIGQWPSAINSGWILTHSNGTVNFVWAPFSTGTQLFNSNIPLVVGNWTNIVLTKSGSSFTLYQNCVVVGSATNAGTKSSTFQIEIGRYASQGHIGARYSMIMIQHKALTATEVLQNFNATKSRFNIL